MLIDVLFQRSRLFRDLVTDDLDTLLTQILGNRKTRVPGPIETVNYLRQTALSCLEVWEEKWGVFYPVLRQSKIYVEKLGYNFPNTREKRELEVKERQLKYRRIYKDLLMDINTLKLKVEKKLQIANILINRVLPIP
eukprot:UN27385